ncbi:unnamed protein product [Vitrella brassicaformis CCMP3155]|uniref:Uncharacterized protein n=1 Tax=Vitrella brassicaformis (strain CCMP3155) TaxID=1169540 RepID=A0A0G4EFB6_VITBC|nr:unnamed protein product [Vitrella brassicaformis CCMP3155]|eukprot:CEL94117.1 unnamed protein product [Vitrella brassicaformis CCMP3155]
MSGEEDITPEALEREASSLRFIGLNAFKGLMDDSFTSINGTISKGFSELNNELRAPLPQTDIKKISKYAQLRQMDVLDPFSRGEDGEESDDSERNLNNAVKEAMQRALMPTDDASKVSFNTQGEAAAPAIRVSEESPEPSASQPTEASPDSGEGKKKAQRRRATVKAPVVETMPCLAPAKTDDKKEDIRRRRTVADTSKVSPSVTPIEPSDSEAPPRKTGGAPARDTRKKKAESPLARAKAKQPAAPPSAPPSRAEEVPDMPEERREWQDLLLKVVDSVQRADEGPAGERERESRLSRNGGAAPAAADGVDEGEWGRVMMAKMMEDPAGMVREVKATVARMAQDNERLKSDNAELSVANEELTYKLTKAEKERKKLLWWKTEAQRHGVNIEYPDNLEEMLAKGSIFMNIVKKSSKQFNT